MDFVKERSFSQGLVTLLVQVVILLNVTNGGKGWIDERNVGELGKI